MGIKKDQVSVGRSIITVDGDATVQDVRVDLVNAGLVPAALSHDAVRFLPGTTGNKVKSAEVTVAYRAKSANTDDIERRLEKVTGRRTHVERIGTFQL